MDSWNILQTLWSSAKLIGTGSHADGGQPNKTDGEQQYDVHVPEGQIHLHGGRALPVVDLEWRPLHHWLASKSFC